MRKKIIGAAILASLLAAHAQAGIDSLRARLMDGIDLTLRQDYPAARRVFNSVIAAEPTNPAGYLYLAGAVQAEFSDYEDGFDAGLFDSLIAQGRATADRLIDTKDSASWGYYFAGTALSYKAFSESERSDWPGVVLDGMNSAKMFERCLEIDPSFCDAMSGLGTYYYWRSKKTEFLSWLPFVRDRKTEGIDMLSKACEGATYEKFLALNSLSLVLTEEGRYDEALRYIREGLGRYPENRSFLWCLVGVLERMPHRDTVALKDAVKKLLASVVAAPVRNVYYEAACRLKLAQYAMDARDYPEVRRQCLAILNYKDLEGKTKRDLGKKLSAAQSLLEKVDSLSVSK
ncbi:MAG TPA: hypothetical protein VMG34_00640 [Bacteroidota bacterium]|nr:hypothetical protein [Bacteroidota bacterium]